MQKLSEIFEQLTYGELSQVAIGGIANGEINEDNYRAVGMHVKLGLTSLYKRFNLKQAVMKVQLFSDVENYQFLSKYAVTGKGTEPKRWILDSTLAPFKEDIIKILTVTADSGVAFPMNDYSNDYSIITPTLESIRVPQCVLVPPNDNFPDEYRTSKLTVGYQANHPNFVLPNGFIDPEKVIIELPSSHVQALLYFVASRVHNPIGMGQEFNAGNNWAQRYEVECRRLEDDGNEIDEGAQIDRITRGGWV